MISPMTKSPPPTRVLLLNHGADRCGVHQFGLAVHRSLAPSTAFDFVYREVESEAEAVAAVAEAKPQAVLVNYHPQTLPWLDRAAVKRLGVPAIGIAHEFDHLNCFLVDSHLFTYRALPDPSVDSRIPNVFVLPRVAPPFEPPPAPEGIPIVGSFGFATGGKGFERIVKLVQRELDEARVRLHIPPSHFADPEGANARRVAERCRGLVTKPGVRLEVTHDFKEDCALLEFLAGNSVNVFLYENQRGRGLSSVIDLAVAAGRPIAISESRMFRHLAEAVPASQIERSTLRDVIRTTAEPIRALKAAWSPEALRVACERGIARVIELDRAGRVPGAVRYNCVLDDAERERYAATIRRMKELVPEMMAKKIERANVQQAFVKETVERFAKEYARPAILCVGSFEDTACESLKKLGHEIEAIDPVVNYDLETFSRLDTTVRGGYDVIFSTSVIEHVPDDDGFLQTIRELLAPGGVAVLTMDYKDGWRPGDPKPAVDRRLYTREDLLGRFIPLLEGCDLVDAHDWIDARPDFTFEGVVYSFATLVFRKSRERGAVQTVFERSLRTELAWRTAQQAYARCDALSHEVEGLRAELEAQRKATIERDVLIGSLVQSRSWRFTEPIRRLARLRRAIFDRPKG
jgi:SAM-dependent methyltransferase